MDKFFRLVYVFALNMNDRLVFRDFKVLGRVPPQQAEISTFKLNVSVGNQSVKTGNAFSYSSFSSFSSSFTPLMHYRRRIRQLEVG